MIQGQYQKIRVKLILKKVIMSIKFPCSLLFSIKSDSIQDLKKPYEIKNGQCIINQAINLELQILQSTLKNRSEDKKIIINVYMVSSSGKVSAGFTTLNLLGKQINSTVQNVQFLQKCPDKGAKIYFSYNIEVFRNRSQRLDKTIINDLRINQRRDTEVSQVQKRLNTFNSMQLPRQLFQEKIQEKYFKNRKSPNPRNSNAQITESKVQQVIPVTKNIRQKVETNYSTYEYKVGNKSRSKSKIKQANSIHSMMPQLNFTPLTTRNDHQEEQEAVKLRQKLRTAEKNQRNSIQAMKQIKQQSEKRKNRLLNLESQKQQLEQVVKQKEEKLKKNDKAIKDLTQRIQQFENQIRSLKSQQQMRQSISRQQTKKMQQKYRASESERQKITNQYNKVLKSFEENEKKFQLLLRQKQKIIHEQRQKWNKKIEIISSTLAQKQSQLKESNFRIDQLTKQSHELNVNFMQNEQKLSGLQQQINEFIRKLKVANDSIKHFQSEIQHYKQLDIQRLQLKKKYNEVAHLNSQYQQKNSKNQKLIIHLQEKIKDLQQQIGKRLNQKNQLSQKLTALKKNYDNLRTNQQIKTKQSESLAQLHNTANNKIVDLKQKLQVEKKTIEDIQRQFEIRYSNISIEKQNLQTESEQLRWQLQKKLGLIQELNNQIKLFNDRNYAINQQLIEKNELLKKFEENNKLLVTNNEYLTTNLNQLEIKKRQNGIQLKELNQSNADLRKKVEKYEKQLTDCRQKIKSLQFNNKQRISEYQKRFKERQQAMHARQAKINQLQTQLKESLDINQNQAHLLTNYSQQISHLKEIISTNKKQLENQQSLILRVKQSDSENRRIIKEKQEQISKKYKEIQELNKRYYKVTEDSTFTLSTLTNNFENYLTQVANSEQQIKWVPSASANLSSFAKIAQLQLQIVQKNNLYVSKNKALRAQLQLQNEHLKYSVSKISVELEEAKHLFEHELTKQKQKFKVIQNSLLLAQQDEKDLQMKYEQSHLQTSKQIQSYRVELNKVNDQKSELEHKISILFNQYEMAKEQYRQLQNKILEFRSQQLRDKSTMESKYQNLAQNHDSQIEQLQSYIHDLQKRAIGIDKQSKQKSELIKKYEQQLYNINYEKDKKDHKIQQLQQKNIDLNNEIKVLNSQIKQKQRDLKKLLESYDQLNRSSQEEKQKRDQLLFKNQQQNNLILDLSKEVQKSKQQIQNLKQKCQQIQSNYKSKFDVIRVQYDRQAFQIKDLKQKNILSASELQLKKFMIKQIETSQIFQKQQKQQLKNEIEKKRVQILKLVEENNILNQKNKQLESTIADNQSERQRLTSNLQKQKTNNAILRKNVEQVSSLNDRLTYTQRQLQKAKDQKLESQNYYQRQLTQMKMAIKEVKRFEASKISREQQLKKKIKILEKLIETDNLELTSSRKRILQQIQRQKRQYYTKNEQLQSKLSQVEDQLESIKSKYRKQIQKMTKEIEDLEQQNNSKDFFIKNQKYQLQNNEYKIAELTQEKNQLEKQLDKEKAKIKAISLEAEKENQSLKQKIKKQQEEQSRVIIQNLQKRLVKSRNKKLEGNTNEFQRILVTSSYRQFQDILTETLREKSRI